MIIHRTIRDVQRCRRKYGKAWEEYERLVPWLFIPVSQAHEPEEGEVWVLGLRTDSCLLVCFLDTLLTIGGEEVDVYVLVTLGQFLMGGKKNLRCDIGSPNLSILLPCIFHHPAPTLDSGI